MGRCAEPYRTRRTFEKKDKIRREYKVPLPDERILFGPVAVDLVAKHGNSGKLGLECLEELITFWRKNRSRYSEEKINAAKHHVCDFTKVFPKGTWEHHFQWKEASRKGVDIDAVRLKANLPLRVISSMPQQCFETTRSTKPLNDGELSKSSTSSIIFSNSPFSLTIPP